MKNIVHQWNWSKVIGHLLAWAFVLLICNAFNWSWNNFTTEDGTIFWSSLYGTATNAFIFYINIWLYSRRKKGSSYPIYLLLILLSVNFLEGNIDYFYAVHEKMDHIERFYQILKEEGTPTNLYSSIYAVGYFINNLLFNTFSLILSFAYIRWEQSIQQIQQLKKLAHEKTKAELQFLKAQINPHFLFNGINSVYHLIDRNADLAKSTLLQFSSLLRYQLYECNEDKILLNKEVAYVEDYLAMEKIRRGEEVKMNIDIMIEDGLLQIAPLLLTPFLENTFKYLSHYSDDSKNKIAVQLYSQNSELHFQIENTYDKDSDLKVEGHIGGIGIQNVRKRLELLYPQKHELSILKGIDTFIVALKIDLS